MHIKHYILVDGVPTEEPNFLKYAHWAEIPENRRTDATVIRESVQKAREYFVYTYAKQCRDRRRPLGHRDYSHFDYHREYIWVSTVFIGIADQLWETMIFGGPLSEYQARYDTLGEAKAGHWTAVTIARRCSNWMARNGNGKKTKKLRARLNQIERLVDKRGMIWAVRRLPEIKRIVAQLEKVPGEPFYSWLPDKIIHYWTHECAS